MPVKPSSIVDWLERLKQGYGDRFTPAFEELGVEDTSDLAELTDAIGEGALKAALEAQGAKTIQIQKIKRAIGEFTGTLASPIPDQAGPQLRGADLLPQQMPAQSLPHKVAAPIGFPVARPLPCDVPGLVNLHGGDGPRVYLVHGIDGDIAGAGFAYRAVAHLLAPCHSSALVFDSEASACDSVQSLALLYNQRIMADAVRHSNTPIIIAAYAFGCVIAHEMALQFQTNFTEICLILLGFEVTWPPEPSWLRVGGYEWLGGDIEAPLQLARSLPGGQDWAAKQARDLARCPREARDAGDVQSRAFAELVAQRRNSRWPDFQSYVARCSHNMEALHQMVPGPWYPSAIFNGKTLLVLASGSPESSLPARYANTKYCSSMEIFYASGTHFNMLQKDVAPGVANAILNFMIKLGYLVTSADMW